MSHGESFPVVETGPVEVTSAHELTLLDFYSDREVTYKGITAPLGTLFQLCPVPHDQMTPESINSFAGKILEDSGIDYDTELRELKALAEEQEAAPAAEPKKKLH